MEAVIGTVVIFFGIGCAIFYLMKKRRIKKSCDRVCCASCPYACECLKYKNKPLKEEFDRKEQINENFSFHGKNE